MINYIKINNGITHHNAQFNFTRGTTAIHGRNGRGKSLIQEFIRFALFGSSALRGKTTDYPKNLEVELSFTTKGEEHVIKRTLNDCYFDDVVGTTACNKAITRHLGYDLSIFDMGNCAKQFEITKLGKMKPTERKQAVDKLIGLDVIDTLIKELKEENTKLKGYLEALSLIQEPKKPELREVIEGLSLDEVKEQLRLLSELKKVRVLLSSENCVYEKPEFNEVEPTPPTGDIASSVRKEQTERQLKEAKEPTAPKYEKDYLLEQQKREFLWKNFHNLVEPKETEEWVAEQQVAWTKYEEWESCVKVNCPSCGKKFSPKGIKKVDKPTSDKKYVQEQFVNLCAWKKKPDCPKAELTESEITVGLKEIDVYEKETLLIEHWKSELEKLKDERPYSEWLTFKEKNDSYKAKKDKYIKDLSSYEKTKELLDKQEALLSKTLSNGEDELETCKLNLIYNDFVVSNYEKQIENYKTTQKEYNKHYVRKEQLELGIKGLNNIKKRIKSSITPNLSRVATDLCFEMTNGEIREIEINEDFEISVDGRNLSLLSGSEEAVANLSIRLALGRILTHKIFNVFVGDEIDAAMDDNRALLVSESLKKLTNQIDQIILISHKKIDADNYIFI